MPVPTYTALIRWRGPDPSLEIETRHGGFFCPEEAALYANGISPGSPQGLHMYPDGSASLFLSEDGEIPCPRDQMTVWVLPPEVVAASDVVVVNDDDFRPVALSEVLLRPGAHGDYLQAQYGVLDQNNDLLDVQVGWDDSDHLCVTVADFAPAAAPEPAFDLGTMPEA